MKEVGERDRKLHELNFNTRTGLLPEMPYRLLWLSEFVFAMAKKIQYKSGSYLEQSDTRLCTSQECRDGERSTWTIGINLIL